MTLKHAFAAAAFFLATAVSMADVTQASGPVPVRAGRPAPIFSLPDTGQKQHSLAEWRGRPVALFFFCGCVPCHHVAALWAQAQDSGAEKSSLKPRTIIVFSGEAAEARTFAAETRLSGPDIIYLLDTQEQTADRYGVTVCPREFALDAQGIVHYTNDEPGSNPQKTAAVSLVSRLLTALAPALPRPHAGKSQGKRILHAP